MKITVFGASGRVGRQVVALATREGHGVIAFVHSNNPFEEDSNISVLKGDINDRSAVTAALAGTDVVVSCLGSWGTKTKNIVQNGMQTIIPAMEELGIRRIVTLTGTAALYSEDKPTTIDKLSHALLGTIAPKILSDGEAHLRLLEDSKLDWTSIRSPAMKNSGKDTYTLDARIGSPLASIPRAAVARAIVDQLNAVDFVRKAPVIHRA